MKDLDSFELFIKDFSNKKTPTEKEEKELLIRVSNGDRKAFNELAERNWKLVLNIAKRYETENLDLLDLFQEGNIGLLKAIEKFDLNMNCRFSTYAVYWIRQSIRAYIRDKVRSVRLPAYIYEDMKKTFREKEDLAILLDKDINKKEISLVTSIPLEKLKKLYEYSSDICSLNATIPGSDMTLEDTIASSDEKIDDIVIRNLIKEEVENLFNDGILNEMEIEVLKIRYGFYDDVVKSFKEVGDIVGLSRQRVHVIENTALRKIRNSKDCNVLANYVYNTKNNTIFVDKDMNNSKKR